MAQTVTKVKPGWATTEFWTHLGVVATTVATLVLHDKFTGAQADIPVVMTACAAVSQAVYTIMRSSIKRQVVTSEASAQKAAPARPARKQTQAGQ